MREPLALLLAGRYAEALALWPPVGAGDPRLLAHRARALYEEGRDEEALQASEEALRAGASHPFVLFARGELLLDVGRPGDALDLFTQALRLDPRNVLVPAYAALARVAAGDRGEGLAELGRRLVPASPPLQSRVARELEMLLGPGEVSFTSFVLEAEEEREPAAFAVLNRMLFWPEALAAWLHVELFARDRRLRRNALMRADRLHRGGQPMAAAEHLMAALAADDHLDLRLAAAEVLLHAGDPGRALQLLPEADPADDPYPSAFRAAALFRAGRHAEAAAILDGVAPMEKEDYTIAYLWGLALLRTGDGRRARRAFEEAFRRDCPFLTRWLVEAAMARLPGAAPAASVQ